MNRWNLHCACRLQSSGPMYIRKSSWMEKLQNSQESSEKGRWTSFILWSYYTQYGEGFIPTVFVWKASPISSQAQRSAVSQSLFLVHFPGPSVFHKVYSSDYLRDRLDFWLPQHLHRHLWTLLYCFYMVEGGSQTPHNQFGRDLHDFSCLNLRDELAFYHTFSTHRLRRQKSQVTKPRGVPP